MKSKFFGTGEHGYNPLRKVLTVISGFKYTELQDSRVVCRLIISLLILIATLVLHDRSDLLLILVATALVLVTEIVKTTIEALCGVVEERHNKKIKIIKDIAATAVGIYVVVWVVVCAAEIGEMWSQISR